MLPQCAALPLVVKSPSGCRAVPPGRTSLANIGERGRLNRLVQARHQLRKGASPMGGRKESVP